MRLLPRLALILALLSCAIAAPLRAQGAPPPAPASLASPAHHALIDAINAGMDREALFQSILMQVRDALVEQNPAVAELEARYPGALDQMIVGITPPLRRHSERLEEVFRAEAAGLAAQRLSIAEARAAADFYASPRGRQVSALVQRNYSVASMAGQVARSGGTAEITDSAVLRDQLATRNAVIRDIAPADLAAIERELAGESWPQRMLELQPLLVALRARLENAPMAAADEAEMIAAIEEVARRLAKQPPAR